MQYYRSRATCLQSLKIGLPRSKMWAEPVTNPWAPRDSIAFHGERPWLRYGFNWQFSVGAKQPVIPADPWHCFSSLCMLNSVYCVGSECPIPSQVVQDPPSSLPLTFYWGSNRSLAPVQGQKQCVYSEYVIYLLLIIYKNSDLAF